MSKPGITSRRVECSSCREQIIALNSVRRRHLLTLERRMEHLKSLTFVGPSEGRADAEIAALKFAIKTVRAHYPEDVE